MMGKNETYVRRYTLQDIEKLVPLIVEEVPKLPNYQGIPIEEDRVRFLLTQNVTAEDATVTYVLVDEEHEEVIGLLAAYCVTSLLSWAKITGDIYLFVKPEWRTYQNAKKLIKAYKEWGLRRKASVISATVTSGFADAVLDRLLTKEFGFVKIGTLYHFRTGV